MNRSGNLLKKHFVVAIIILTFLQPYSHIKTIAQQTYPPEWYVPKLWDIQKDGVCGLKLIDNTLFYFKNSDRKTTMTRLNRNNGKSLWSQDIPDLYVESSYYGAYWATGDIKIQGNKLFFSNRNNKQLICYDVNTGNVLWKQELIGYLIKCDPKNLQSSPVPICEKVLLWVRNSSRSVVLCYDSETGDLVWRNEKAPFFYYDTYNDKCFQYEDRFYYQANSPRISCIDINNGDLIWKSEIITALTDELVFFQKDKIIECYTYWSGEGSYIFKIDMSNGYIISQDKILDKTYYLIRKDMLIYQDFVNNEYVAYSLNDKKEKWRIDYLKLGIKRPEFYNNDIVIFAKVFSIADDFYVDYSVGVNADNGLVLWQTKGDIEKYARLNFITGRFFNYSSYKFICFGDPAIDYPEPPSRITDSMSFP